MAKSRGDAPALSLRSAPWRSALLRRSAIVVAGSLVLALSAQIQVPAFPVPITMQSFAVIALAMIFGSRLGVGIVLAYLAEGAAGLPVFAGFKAGLPHLVGPTGGYLLGFVVTAWLAGALAERGWARGLVKPFANAMAAHLVLLTIGTAYLGSVIGFEAAFWAGFAPFIIGSVLKSALAAALVKATDGARRCLPILR